VVAPPAGAITRLGVAACGDPLREGGSADRGALDARRGGSEQRVDEVALGALELGLRERRQAQQLDPSGERLLDLARAQDVRRPAEQEPSRLLLAVLYRVLPGLEEEGKVNKQGRGWHPKTA
jgi:hypothetical protein